MFAWFRGSTARDVRACSLDDTLTDLMCHPEDYSTWVNSITASLRSGNGLAGKVGDGPGLRLPRYDSGTGSCCRGGAGHSGAMRLAASLVKDLLRSRRLEKLLGWGAAYGMDEGSRGVPQLSADGSMHSSGCLGGAPTWSWQRSFGRSPSSSSYRCGLPRPHRRTGSPPMHRLTPDPAASICFVFRQAVLLAGPCAHEACILVPHASVSGDVSARCDCTRRQNAWPPCLQGEW